MKRTILSLLAILLITANASSQVIKPVKWTYSTRQISKDQVDLVFTAAVQSPWHLYGLNIPEGGPIPTSINFSETKGFEVLGKPTQSPKPEIVDDKIFNMKLELHSGKVIFTQRVRIIQTDSVIISGVVDFMTCSDIQCVPGDDEFVFRLKGTGEQLAAAAAAAGAAAVEAAAAIGAEAVDEQQSDSVVFDTAADFTASATATATDASTATATATDTAKKSLWGVFLLSLLAGLGGLLTPCVYPMIPMTVSYFLRGNKSRGKAISQALVFGLSIVFIYTLIGILVAVFKNPNAVNNFTTHWATNLIFFLIFLILSASFFGMFEIMLPSGLANKVDQQADKGGYVGAFFMALAMAILSFSCTGPIVASLLIKASQGEVLEPVIGMMGFSLVFALPFTLFAIFPSWLQNLPKSGSWLNAIKVFFAFVMLAFSLYFLGKIDQSYHLNLISRDLFLSVWIVIFTLLGFYLLGKIKFAHDSDLTQIGVPRFIFAVAVFSFAFYLFTGFLGNELKGLSTILPPAGQSQGAAPTAAAPATANAPNSICSNPKYSDFLSLPHGLQGYFEYEEALACAREKNKPVLVDFVGHTCSNCKKMYSEVWSDPRVLQKLRDEFIIVALYTDDKTKLPEKEWVTSTSDGKIKNTLGKKNQDFEITRFNSNALPLYAIVDANGNDLSKTYYTYDPDIDRFLNWLEEAIP
ncbi:MAG: thioredoxin family protein [Bacteroidales bacterium]|nr:thioredoxin family protein [Bacteroidales bacterium]